MNDIKDTWYHVYKDIFALFDATYPWSLTQTFWNALYLYIYGFLKILWIFLQATSMFNVHLND